MEILSHSTQETSDLARKLVKKLKPNDVLALYGDLGSGKTTFTGFLVDALNIDRRVQSPTFVILRKYSNGGENIKVVNHVDLYRLTKKEEVSDLGLDEIFDEKNALTIIEWPKLIEDILPKSTICIYFEYVDENIRRINVQNIN